MSEWRKLTLGELIESGHANLQTGPFGTMLNSSEYVPSGIPVIAVQDIGNNRLIHDRFVFVSKATAKRLERYKVRFGDIIFGRKGAVDRRAIVKKPEEGWLQGSDCIRLRFNDDIDSRFVSYQFGSSFHKEWMLQNAGGATMPSLNQQILKLLPITLPPLSEQRAITTVLASLDDKIDLLQRQNKTLEDLAQTLFRHWFVDRATDDWEVGTLDNVLTAKGGTTPSTNNSEFWDGDIHWTTPRDLSNNNSPYLLNTERKITESGLAKISTGLLPKGTLLLSSRAPIGYIAFAEVPIAINQGYIAILDNKGFSKHLIYLWLKENMDYIISYANGSTFLEISKSAFRSLEFIIPPAKLRVDFEQIIAPLFEKIRTNVHQIRTLEKLRDTLLPKFMNGEVQVGEVPGLFERIGVVPAPYTVSVPKRELVLAEDGMTYRTTPTDEQLVFLETCYQLEQSPSAPMMGKTIAQKCGHALQVLDRPLEHNFGRGANGPYSVGFARMLDTLQTEGFIRQERRSDYSAMTVVCTEPQYARQREEFASQIESFQPKIKQVVALFKRIKNTAHAEEVATVLFVTWELQAKYGQNALTLETIINEVTGWKPHWQRPNRIEKIKQAIDLLQEMEFIALD